MQLKSLFAAAVMLTGSACSDLTPHSQSAEIIADIEPPRVIDGDHAVPANEFGFFKAMEPGPMDMFSTTTNSTAELAVADVNTDDVTSAEEASATAEGAADQQIAYSYGYGFRIDADEIVELQDAHIAICEEMGDKCRILRTSQARSDSWDAYAELRMEVAADRAGSLSEALEAPAEELGGALISSVRNGEDLTDQIIDTEAHLGSRLLLRDRLTEILRTNSGSVQELVAAEEAVAKVNEEIDAARARLEEYRGRITYSAVNIEYEPAFGETQIGFVRPIASAFRSIGSTLGLSVAAIIYLLTALLPFALLILGLRWVLHRFGLRIRWWKRGEKA